eukprot:11024280-Alexandrium_andersonii.AAC.1
MCIRDSNSSKAAKAAAARESIVMAAFCRGGRETQERRMQAAVCRHRRMQGRKRVLVIGV